MGRVLKLSTYSFSSLLILFLMVYYPFSRILMTKIPVMEDSIAAFALLVIGYSFVSGNFLKGLSKRHSLGVILVFLLFSTLLGSFFAREINDSLQDWYRLTVSVIFCFSVSGFRYKEDKVYTFLKWFSIAYTILCALSIIDYFGYYEIQGFNDNAYLLTDDATHGIDIKDITGPYRQRSQFASNLSICFPIGLYYVAAGKKDRLLWAIISLVLICTILLTFSRAVYLSLAFVILFYAWYRVINLKFLLALSFLIFLISSAISPAVRELIYIGYKTIEARFLQVSEGTTGDTWRYDALMQTVEDLKTSPLGLGFNRIWSPELNRFANPHSLYTSYFRAGGPIAILAFFSLLGGTFVAISKRNIKPEILPLVCSIFSMMIYAVTHLSISIIFWCFVGLIFSLKKYAK